MSTDHDSPILEAAARIAGANAQAIDRMLLSHRYDDSMPFEAWTKDALYQRAKSLCIDGRAHMSKPRLIAALRAHLSQNSPLHVDARDEREPAFASQRSPMET